MSFIRRQLAKLGICSSPDFIVAGTQKGGSTTLFELIRQHPKVSGSLWKEVNYFDNDAIYSPQKKYKYHQFFPLPFEAPAETKHYFECTPNYLYHPHAPKRMHQYNPELKIIMILREPAERALSSWTMHHYEFGPGNFENLYDPRSFSEAINEEIAIIDEVNFYSDERSYIKRGLYFEQVMRYLNFFPEGQILILDFQELQTSQDLLLRKVWDFLELSPIHLAPTMTNERIVQNHLDYEDTLNKLRSYYKPFNKELFELINHTFDWNSR